MTPSTTDTAGSEPRVFPLRIDRSDCPAPCTAWQRLKYHAFSRSTLLRSAAFRIGMSFWLLFSLVTGIAGYGFYMILQERVMGRIEQAITERYDLTRAVYEARGVEGVVEIVEGRGLLPMHSSMGFRLSAADGSFVTGDVPEELPEKGWTTVSGESLGMAGDHERYRFLTADLGPNRLSLGMSLKNLDELRGVALQCLLITFLGSMLIAVLAAILITGRMQKRMRGFSCALERVASGDLAARVPVSAMQDGIDDMALTVNAALSHLKLNVDAMRQVSTDIAHDLKTPLNRLYIHLEEAMDCVRVDGRPASIDGASADGESALERALDETRQINGTFEALLRVAQIEGGSPRAKFRHFDLAEVMATVIEVYEPVIEESGKALIDVTDTTGRLPMFGDRDLVLQLAVNLVENAIRHCEDCREIEIGAGKTGDGVYLSVADNGPGIPAAEHERVFQRLYRLERSRTTPGSGLGLSLVKAIADLHCGKLELADNEPGLRIVTTFERDCPEAVAG